MVVACRSSHRQQKCTTAKPELEAAECVAHGSKFWWLARPCAWAAGGPEESQI
jgi:hypothetical protein